MKTWFKWSGYLIALVATLALLLTGGGYFYLKHLLPQIDGEIGVPGLSRPATIVRDGWGVPHITAETDLDAYTALGFTVAQDRLFQMELQRRLAKGELAEILGPSLVKVDKMFRTLMLRHRGEAYLAQSRNIHPRALAQLDAFLKGVNQCVATQPLPVEFKLLGITPEPFTRLDTMSLVGYVAYSFADGMKRDSLYTILSEVFTPDELALVFPDYTRENRTTIMEPQGLFPESAEASRKPASALPNAFSGLAVGLDQVATAAEALMPPIIGSNSWTLAPSRTASGNAILANDPHIGIANPGVWYEAHVQYPGYENYGYHLPLLPFPMLAHNRHRAWGLTMFENDDLDLYAETFNPDNADQVKYKGEWAKVRTLTETIKVKGQADETLTIRITPHGPVVSDLIAGYSGDPVAMSWVYLNEDNPILDVVYGMANAQALPEFRAALSRLSAPGLNVSYADAQGNIAWWAAGKVPIRPAGVSGLEIHEGATGAADWLGYLPFDKNPQMVNPESGIIITANNLPSLVPTEPVGILTGYFRPGDRAARIYELLSAKERWTMADLQKVQTDTRLWGGETMGRQMAEILAPHASEFTSSQTRAFEALRDWDGFMELESVGGTVFQFTHYHILKTTLEGRLGAERLKTYLNLVDHWDFLKIMLKTPDFILAGADKSEAGRDRDSLVLEGFKAAVAEMETRLQDNWRWGNVQTIEYVHAVGRKKPLNRIFNIGPYPCPAAFTAVNKMSSKTGDHTYQVVSIPSTRRLIDLKNPQDSWSIIPTGNAGNFMSPYYDNQAEIYLKGVYRRLNLTPEQVRETAVHTLVLRPN